MKFIQSLFLSSPFDDSPSFSYLGYSSLEAFSIAWAASLFSIKKFHGNVELYTNDHGYRLLIEALRLPYFKVHLLQIEVSNAQPFSLSKLYVYSIQQEPFVHLDGDVILFKPIQTENSNAVLVEFEISDNFTSYVDHLFRINHMTATSEIGAMMKSSPIMYNFGIFGGYPFELIANQSHRILKCFSEAKWENVWFESIAIEQLCLSTLLSKNEILFTELAPMNSIVGYQLRQCILEPLSMPYIHLHSQYKNIFLKYAVGVLSDIKYTQHYNEHFISI